MSTYSTAEFFISSTFVAFLVPTNLLAETCVISPISIPELNVVHTYLSNTYEELREYAIRTREEEKESYDKRTYNTRRYVTRTLYAHRSVQPAENSLRKPRYVTPR